MLIHSPPYYGFDVFAKSHQRNAALSYYDILYPNFPNNKEMKRRYTKRNSGKLCVQVKWDKEKSYFDTEELLEVKNLGSNRVEPATSTTLHTDSYYFFFDVDYYTYFQWNHLDEGEYEITLFWDKRQPSWEINLCQDSASMMLRTWTSIPKEITKCQFRLSHSDEYSVGPSSPPDPKLKPKWTLEEWVHVCERLGIFSNDTEVQIKFCNFYGCNFSKCPHLHDEPPYIFDF